MVAPTSTPLPQWAFAQLSESLYAGVGITITDLQGKILYANPLLAKWLELPDTRQLLGHTFMHYYSTQSQEVIKQSLSPHLFKEHRWEGELELFSHMHHTTQVKQHCFLLYNQHRFPTYIANILLPSTQEVNVAPETSGTRSLFEKLIMKSNQIVIIGDDIGKVRYANPSALALLGYDKDEIVKINMIDLIKDLSQTEFDTIFQQAQKERNVNMEGKLIRKDKARFPCALSFNLITNGSGVYTVLAATDLTQFKRHELAVQQQRLATQTLNRIVMRFVREEADKIDMSIQASLEMVGNYLNAGRTFIMVFSDDKSTMTMSHEWIRPGISSRHDRRTLSLQEFYWFTYRILGGESVRIFNLEELLSKPANINSKYIHDGVKSLLLEPLLINNKVIGFIGIESLRKTVQWDEISLEFLQRYSNVLTHMYLQKFQTQMRDTNLRELRDNLMHVIGLIENVTDTKRGSSSMQH